MTDDLKDFQVIFDQDSQLNHQNKNLNSNTTTTNFANKSSTKRLIHRGSLIKSSSKQDTYYLCFNGPGMLLEGDIQIGIYVNKIRKDRLFSFWFNTAFIKPVDPIQYQSTILSLENQLNSSTTSNSSNLDFSNNSSSTTSSFTKHITDRHRHNSMINTTQSIDLTSTFNSLNMHQPCLTSKSNLNNYKSVGGCGGELEEGNSANSSISSVCSNASINSSSFNFTHSQQLFDSQQQQQKLVNDKKLNDNYKSTNDKTSTQSDQNANNNLNSSFESTNFSNTADNVLNNGNSNGNHQPTTLDTTDDLVKENDEFNNKSNGNRNLLNKKQFALNNNCKTPSFNNNGYSKNSSNQSSQTSSNCNLIYCDSLTSSTNYNSDQRLNNSNHLMTTDSSCSIINESSSSRLSTSSNNLSKHRHYSGPALDTTNNNNDKT